MSGKKYFRRIAQSDHARGYKMPPHLTRDWPTWAFDAYALSWLSSQFRKIR